MGIVNLSMLSHPVNWLIVWVVLALSALAWHQVHKGVMGCSCNDKAA